MLHDLETQLVCFRCIKTTTPASVAYVLPGLRATRGPHEVPEVISHSDAVSSKHDTLVEMRIGVLRPREGSICNVGLDNSDRDNVNGTKSKMNSEPIL